MEKQIKFKPDEMVINEHTSNDPIPVNILKSNIWRDPKLKDDNMKNGGKFLLKINDQIIINSSHESDWLNIEKQSEEWNTTMHPFPLWEYYMRRGNRYYFRSNRGDKVIAEVEKPVPELDHYGPVEIDLGIME